MDSLVSIIIPHWNGIDVLSECLDSLEKTVYPNFEIIVVDNASTDGSGDWIKNHHPQIKLIKNDKNYGYAGGCNRGVLQADGELVVFLNIDTVQDIYWLRNLVSFISDGAATGPTLYMRNDATTTTVKALQVANTTADIFSVTVAGDATVANDLTIAGDFVVTGNLSVAGATTEINTATTLVRDKTLVLGVASGGTIACTFDSHASAPTFTTVGAVAHNVIVDSVIFIAVTGSADNGVSAEALYTVATAANSTIFTLSGTIDTQAGTRTLQFSGPQTDALIDDAGIYLPGATEIHSFKWDNTDNYWETTDSLFINDSGQLVLPKGTDAQRPASSATATVPAATTGAIRYNSDTSKVEAVLTSTSYENMSTETLATAIAIALG